MKRSQYIIMMLLILLVLCVLVVLLTDALRTKAGAIFLYKMTDPYTDTYREGEYYEDQDMKLVIDDLRYFPIPESTCTPDATVSYENSWMFERTYGGKRGHEGCDIMAGINERGLYPVVSMSDGVVEKLGWLRQGGYRIGIRTTHGGYCYYAHLYSYAEGLMEGDLVKAGQLIGYMGDSGYSDTVGAVGNFAVHLHVGFYISDQKSGEISLNPYPLLKGLEDKKLKYYY